MKKKIFSSIALIALVAILTVCMVACIPSDPAKAKANLESAGYNAKVDSSILVLAVKDSENIVIGTSKNGKEVVLIVYFKSKEGATLFFNDNKDSANKVLKDLGFSKEGAEITLEKTGKIVYLGTAAAIKAVG